MTGRSIPGRQARQAGPASARRLPGHGPGPGFCPRTGSGPGPAGTGGTARRAVADPMPERCVVCSCGPPTLMILFIVADPGGSATSRPSPQHPKGAGSSGRLKRTARSRRARDPDQVAPAPEAHARSRHQAGAGAQGRWSGPPPMVGPGRSGPYASRFFSVRQRVPVASCQYLREGRFVASPINLRLAGVADGPVCGVRWDREGAGRFLCQGEGFQLGGQCADLP